MTMVDAPDAADWTPEVVVLGGGAAGTLAAVAAARAGRRTLVVRRGDGATSLSSGAVDTGEHHDGRTVGPARSPLDGGRDWLDAARALAAALPHHPYARVDGAVDALPEALALLRDVAAEVNISAHPDGRMRAVVTAGGTVKRTTMVQDSMVHADLAGVALRGERIGVVHWPECLHGDGHHAARVLAHVVDAAGLGAEVVPLSVTGVLSDMDALRAPRDQARALDTPDGHRRVVDAIRFALHSTPGITRVLVPPILGVDGNAALLRALRAAIPVPVAEMPSPHPSVPGLRLQRALEAGLVRAGVRATDARVTAAHVERGRVVAISLERRPGETQVVATPRVVLCTGRFIPGGIQRDGGFREPLLDLPLFLDGNPVPAGWVGDVVAERPESAQAFMRVGVLTDGRLHPVDAAGRVVLSNAWAAGSILAGYDTARHQGGLGVAAVTGMMAGRFAAS